MALYFLSYDLRKARNYQPLYDELNRIRAVRVLESVWSFEMDNTNTATLRDHLRNYLDADDGVLVVKASEWASFNLSGNPPTPKSWV